MNDQFRQGNRERTGADAGADPEAAVNPLHAEARALAEASSEAISRALSSHSQQFMEAHVQTGGE
jgi:hypothetical protein